MTLQEIFDTVATHLLTQNAKSMHRIPRTGQIECAYRGDNGKQCAVGCLIPEKFYSPSLEGMGVGAEPVRNAIPFELDMDSVELLRRLQAVHDSVPVEEWSEELRELAAAFLLSHAVVQNHATTTH